MVVGVEETALVGPGENPCVRTGDHRTLSHTPLRGSNHGRNGDKRVANHCAIRSSLQLQLIRPLAMITLKL